MFNLGPCLCLGCCAHVCGHITSFAVWPPGVSVASGTDKDGNDKKYSLSSLSRLKFMVDL